VYYKTPETLVLDDEEGDLDALIKDTEAMIAAELEEDIMEHESALRSSFSALAELDVILAFAAASLEMNGVRPEIVERSEVMIQNGRSPLQAIITDHQYIPNDVLLTTEDSIAMITGPNFSGKSSYLSMVGLLV
jgi:DNA mismatch repair ATPase MutS